MTFVPKRKRRLHGLPKVFLYSTTLLSVVGGYAAPAVNVLADAQEAPKPIDNQQPKTEAAPQLKGHGITPRSDYTYQVKYYNFVDNSYVGDGTATTPLGPGGSTDYRDIRWTFPTETDLMGNVGLCQLPNSVTTPFSALVRKYKMDFHFTCVNADGSPLKDRQGNVIPVADTKFDHILEFSPSKSTYITRDDLPAHLKARYQVANTFKYDALAKGKGLDQTIKLQQEYSNIITFQDMYTGLDLPNPVTIWGFASDPQIDLTNPNLVPAGYEIAHDNFKKVTITNTNDYPKRVYVRKLITNQVQFVDVNDSNRAIGASQQVTGPQGKDITSDKLSTQPEHYGYRYQNGSFPTGKTFDPSVSQIPINVVFDHNITNHIQFVTQANPNTPVAPATDIQGQFGKPVTQTITAPTGYHLVTPNIQNSLRYLADGENIKVYVQENTQATNHIQFVDNDDPTVKIGPLQEVQGIDGTAIPASQLSHTPSEYGYRYVGGSFPSNLNYDSVNDELTVRVEYDHDVTNHVHFVDQANPGDTFDTSKTVQGKYKTNVPVSTISLPAGYELDTGKPTPKFVADNGTVDVYIKKSIFTNVIDFTLNGAPLPLVSSQSVQGALNDPITIDPNWIPGTYELNGTPNLRIIGTNGQHQTVDLKLKTPNSPTVTNNIKYVDEDGNQIGSNVSIQGTLGSTIPGMTLINNIPDSHYELANGQGNLSMGANGTTITVNLQGKTYNNTVSYINVADNTQVGTSVAISGRYKRSVTQPIQAPTGYHLQNQNIASTLKYGAEGYEHKINVVEDQITYTNIIDFTLYGNPTNIASSQTVTGLVNSAITIDPAWIPNGYEIRGPIPALRIVGSNNVHQVIDLKKKPPVSAAVSNIIKYVDPNGNQVGATTTINGLSGSVIPASTLARYIPDSHYELASNQGDALLGADGTTITVHVQGRTYNNTISYIDAATNRKVGSSTPVTGRYKESVTQTIQSPSGYHLQNANIQSTLTYGVENFDIKVPVVADNAPQPNPPRDRNYIQFVVNGLYYGNKITINGRTGDSIDLRSYLPSGYELEAGVNPIVTFGLNGANHFINIKRKAPAPVPSPSPSPSPSPTPSPSPVQIVNYIQFTYNGINIGEKIRVSAQAGGRIDLRSILPDGYELEDGADPFVTVGLDGSIKYVPIKKKVAPAIVNYVQFTVDGTNLGTQNKIAGSLGSTVDIASLIPTGYELVDSKQEITIAADGTVHKVALKKIAPAQVTNFVQFTVDGLNLGEAKTFSGALGSSLDFKSMIPAGYELVDPAAMLKFGLDQTTHSVALKKVAAASVDNYVQFTIDGKNYSVVIKRTGAIGDPIDITPWIPAGYELAVKGTKISFAADGTIHEVAIVKAATPEPVASTVTNYIQFIADGVSLGDPVAVEGETGTTVDLAALIPTGYTLADPAGTIIMGLDQVTHQVELKKIVTDPVTVTRVAKPYSKVGTATKYGTLPQLGSSKVNTVPLGLMSVASAGASAVWLSSKKRANKKNLASKRSVGSK
ncbi:MucBP domain-containing protein [Xylocopilactobacillus apicola]|uniref:MucBP domain-containing protein n=1 Tax=Xylocopilactobacillus apicola TaxID=2932184 RepID=A0AAU9D7U6_9LACO|nr:MucBP domain-containing protein [Xylocopilactobacillus apicola]BDR59623.1 hypothetical protein XA3_20640 [Xylocopilactobacillus apicola]